MSKFRLEILTHQAREAVACSYCFRAGRALEWGRIPERPAHRPDDVALAPCVGPHYSTATPRVVVMMLNPGHAPAPHKITRKELGRQIRNAEITYEEYNVKLALLVREWGFGAVVRWLRTIKLEPKTIAVLNVVLCAVANDAYFPKLFEACFKRHTRSLVGAL